MTGEFIKASKQTGAPFSMIEQKGLFARLREEAALAAREIARDPRGFIRDLFADDSRDARRRRRIYIGLTCAIIGHVALFVVMLVLGWPQMLTPAEEEAKLKLDHMITIAKANEDVPPPAQQDLPRGDNGGGGGGGQNNPLPASGGVLPQMTAVPSEVKLTPPVIAQPSLPITPTIVGPDSPPPPPDTPLGDPNATSATPSGGPGSGGGIGDGKGTGVGPGGGPGAGPGSGGGTGTRTAGTPDGSTLPTGPIDWKDLKQIPGSAQFSWIYRPLPVVTPEAQKNKSIGVVTLRATFNANGTITDISVISSEVPEMTESAIQSVAQSRFRPATVKGVPITVRNVVLRVNVHY